MRVKPLHAWDLTPPEAIALQKKLAQRVILKKQFLKIRTVAGLDIAIDTENNEGIGGAIIFSFPDLECIEKKSARKKLNYPYIPGLLSFREIPALLEVIQNLKNEPDLFIVDGQGVAHPRNCGIASHLGLILDKPAIGCAKSLLCGEYREPGKKAGSVSVLEMKRKVIGAVVRTRTNVKPVFISPGHKIDLKSSVKIILQCCDGFRIPKPTRETDHYVNALKRGEK